MLLAGKDPRLLGQREAVAGAQRAEGRAGLCVAGLFLLGYRSAELCCYSGGSGGLRVLSLQLWTPYFQPMEPPQLLLVSLYPEVRPLSKPSVTLGVCCLLAGTLTNTEILPEEATFFPFTGN